MIYPKLLINKQKLVNNLEHVIKLCHTRGISTMGVTKVMSDNDVINEIFAQSNLDYIADSRIDNLKYVSKKPKVLLRIAMHSELEQLVEYVDISLQSSLQTIQKINELTNTEHRIILMFDVGDLREGIYYKDDYLSIVGEILKLENIKLYGIGTNITCYGGVLPTIEVMNRLVEIAEKIEKSFNLKLEIISGGNSSSYDLVAMNTMPPKINNLRLGEVIFLGRETAYGRAIAEMHQDVVVLQAEVVEKYFKPSLPDGKTGLNAFGEKTTFVDEGEMHRLILGIGRQDVDLEGLLPFDDSLRILGGSSDHLLVHDSKNKYKLGDVVNFKLSYASLLSLATSKYVNKEVE